MFRRILSFLSFPFPGMRLSCLICVPDLYPGLVTGSVRTLGQSLEGGQEGTERLNKDKFILSIAVLAHRPPRDRNPVYFLAVNGDFKAG